MTGLLEYEVRDAVREALSQGFVLPVLVSMVSVNGSTFVGRVELDGSLVTLVEALCAPGFTPPINFFVIECATGEVQHARSIGGGVPVEA